MNLLNNETPQSALNAASPQQINPRVLSLGQAPSSSSSSTSSHQMKAQQLIMENQLDALILLLQNERYIDITVLLDKKQFSLLHHIVLNFDLNHVSFMIDYAKSSLLAINSSATAALRILTNWINQKNVDGFSSLLYASHRGDINMIKLLIKHGADWNSKSAKGLNMLHIAAQGDQPISLRYFQKLGISPHDLEYKSSNPLHWASYLGNENAIAYLTSYTDIDLNQTDSQGLSPLHLAVISGNTRAVKRLLLKGADKKQQNNKGQTPGQLAEEMQYENIQTMLEEEGGFQEYYNLKQPFKPVHKSLKQIYVFFALFFSIEGAFSALILPCLSSQIQIGIWAGLQLLVIGLYLCCWLVNPGQVSTINDAEAKSYRDLKRSLTPKGGQYRSSNRFRSNLNKTNGFLENQQTINSQPENSTILNQAVSIINENLQNGISSRIGVVGVNTSLGGDIDLETQLLRGEKLSEGIEEDVLLRLYEHFDIDDICIDCKIEKPIRSKHCEVCKKCVRVYDHHCPWIDNCVGCGNFKYFVSFLVFLWLGMAATLALVAAHITTDYADSTRMFNWVSSHDSSFQDLMVYVKYGVSGVIIIVVLTFFIMLSALLFVQLKNMFMNKTTYERFSARHAHSESSKLSEAEKSSRTFQGSDLGKSLDNNQNAAASSGELRLNSKRRSKKSFNSNTCQFSNIAVMCCTNQNNPEFDFDHNKLNPKQH